MGAQLLFNIGVALILFHGGVGISLRVISRTAVGIGLLVLPGVFITAFIVALVIAPIFGVSLLVAFMIGSVLASTDPAILIPLFERLGVRPKVSQTVIAESAFNDVTGTVLVLTLVEGGRGRSPERSPGRSFKLPPKELALGAVVGLGAGLLLAYAVASTARAGIWDESPGVAILALVALVYFFERNPWWVRLPRRLRHGPDRGQHGRIQPQPGPGRARECLRAFVAQVAKIAVLLIFVTLGMNLPFDALGQYLFGGLLVMAVFIFVSRPVTVFACLLPDRRGRWSRNEMIFLSWCRYTGVIPAAVASILLARGVGGGRDRGLPRRARLSSTTRFCKRRQPCLVARRLGLIEATEQPETETSTPRTG